MLNRPQSFRALPAGSLYVHDGKFASDAHPHVVYAKVDARHYQRGMRYPDARKITLPLEGVKLKDKDPNEHVILITDTPAFAIERK